MYGKINKKQQLFSRERVRLTFNLLIICSISDASIIRPSGVGRKFLNFIVNETKGLWIRKIKKALNVTARNQNVENMLRAWMKDNKPKKRSVDVAHRTADVCYHFIIGNYYDNIITYIMSWSSLTVPLRSCPQVGCAFSDIPLACANEIFSIANSDKIYINFFLCVI